MNIRVAVIGYGMMGLGVIHTYASKGIKVIAIKRREEDCRLQKYLKNELEKGKITTQEYEEIINNIEITTDINKAITCQLVIENINEDLELKRELFAQLDKICPKETVLATNTSSIPISQIASATNRGDKVVGMHFMSPVPIMKLVEIVKGAETSEEVIRFVYTMIEKIEKIPVVVKDSPGFVASRLLAVLVNEAASIAMEGIADFKDIDLVAKYGLNHPIGPLRLADEVGLDIAVEVLDNMYHSFKNLKYEVCPQLRTLKNSGNLGRKTGKGYYNYE